MKPTLATNIMAARQKEKRILLPLKKDAEVQIAQLLLNVRPNCWLCQSMYSPSNQRIL
jgi:hypothetical protein